VNTLKSNDKNKKSPFMATLIQQLNKNKQQPNENN
jgi:hypothetical protein